MSMNLQMSKALIAQYLGKDVTAELDGKLFDHVAATFAFHFRDPEELQAELADNYSDELRERLPCIKKGVWVNDQLIPIAEVSKAGQDYKFAWLFFDWRVPGVPRVLVTTTDRWKDDRVVETLESLELKVA